MATQWTVADARLNVQKNCQFGRPAEELSAPGLAHDGVGHGEEGLLSIRNRTELRAGRLRVERVRREWPSRLFFTMQLARRIISASYATCLANASRKEERQRVVHCLGKTLKNHVH